MFRSLSAIVLLLVACQPAPETIQVRSQIAATVVQTTSAAANSSRVQPPPIGVWHLRAGEAVNLDIRTDGTFVWGLSGCDSTAGGEGRWTRLRDGSIELEPADPTRWPGGVTIWMHEPALRVTQQGNEITVASTNPQKAAPAELGEYAPKEKFPQKWQRGTVCAQCGGRSLGPEGIVPCNEPVTSHPGPNL